MKKQDLRIGNYLKFHGRFGMITELRSEDIVLWDEHYEEGRGTYDYPYYEHEGVSGIPLTNEWMECLGMELNGKTDLWTIGDFGIHFDLDVISTNANEDLPKRDLMDIREIKYVHELQNLYHAITGKELEMKNIFNNQYEKLCGRAA